MRTVTGRVAGRNGRRVVMRGRRDLEHGCIRFRVEISPPSHHGPPLARRDRASVVSVYSAFFSVVSRGHPARERFDEGQTGGNSISLAGGERLALIGHVL